MEYLNHGGELLAADSWNIQYNLTLSLYEETAEISYLIGDFVRTSKLVEIVLIQAKTILDKVKIYAVSIQAYIAQNLQIKAVETAVNILNILGLELPSEANQSDSQLAMEQTKSNFLGQSIQDLIVLPKMTEPEKLAAMHVLYSVMSASYQAAPNLLPLLVCQQVNLSLSYGNTFISAFSYAMYGLILCGEGDIELGCEVSELALQLLSIFKEKQFKCKILNVIYGYIRIWKYPLRECLNPLLEAYQAGLESGDFEFACNAAYNYFSIASHIGEDLTLLAHRMEIYGQAMLRYKQEAPLNVHKIFWQPVLNLIGKSEYKYQVIGEIYDEQIMLPIYLNDNNSFAIYLLHTNKTYLSYLFHEYEQANQHCLVTEKYVGSLSGAFHVSLFYFYDSLIKLALFPQQSSDEKELIMAKVAANQQRIKEWAEHAPKNYWHKFYLVEAEKHRVLKKNAEAIEYYDRTIKIAKENEYLNDEALAYEL
ncbi:hypothetical protein ICL16_06790 [Iningainema sp. BLCCT55]|uniref:Uncharacterized protein n=1 Tax=Iningainema tapete BLCC-T55 TaxID=2748662 RepID=A0A8J6XGU0_9CYAN|nr:hypothetical protein [Iningainema tapete BLCC-T55]